jgi:hypothetical protein
VAGVCVKGGRGVREGKIIRGLAADEQVKTTWLTGCSVYTTFSVASKVKYPLKEIIY